MKFDLEIFLAALGLAMVLEGLPYFVAPTAVKKTALKLLEFRGAALRAIGLLSILGGLALVAIARSLG